LENTGITSAFQLIFSELILKNIAPENHFSYAVTRLKEINREIKILKNVKKVI